MLTLGLAGGLDNVHEQFLDSPDNYTYDGAAVLVEDGCVVAAIEEERLNRIKRSNKFPFEAIRFCLAERRARLQDIDQIGYYVKEEVANSLLSRLYLARPDIQPCMDARTLLATTLSRGLGSEIDPAKLRFIEHKYAHAVCAMNQSGFDESLVFVIDNASGVYIGRRNPTGRVCLDPVAAMPTAKSLGRFCQAVLPFLGLGIFDEYKALAMAPYGDPAVYRPLTDNLYELLPNGDYVLHLNRAGALIGNIELGRNRLEPNKSHWDLAAALQEAMERIVLHVVHHHRYATDQQNLCMAGGVAENTSINGRVLYSGLFEQVFVHPVAYDSGCALGAALFIAEEEGCPSAREPVRHVYWGTTIGDQGALGAELDHWRAFIEFEKIPDPALCAAELLAQGEVVGWLQGRSEFGSHALGNRNIVVDPRPELNRALVNDVLNRREPYRPLGIAVLEEEVDAFFDLPCSANTLSFMSFAVKVREDKRPLLRAATHVDGMARLQTVSCRMNPFYWRLIRAFRELTGLPALASASLNSSFEPTVDSVADAVVTMLTTRLEYMVAGDFLVIKKHMPSLKDRLSLWVSLPPYVTVVLNKGLIESQRENVCYEISASYDSQLRRRISWQLGDALLELNREAPVAEFLNRGGDSLEQQQALFTELKGLWSERLVVMRPGPAGRSVA